MSKSLRITYREARVHAVIVAVCGWLSVVAFVAGGKSERSAFGPLKWSDFVHFYTLGYVARSGESALLYDSRALHDLQSRLVPASTLDGFTAIYPPQTGLLFVPLSHMPYVTAGAIWAAISLGVYLGAVWAAWNPARTSMRDGTLVFAAALAFPPVWQLAMYGQTTAIVVVAFGLGLWALERGRPFMAGLAVSLLAVKPQWGLVLAVVAIAAAEMKLILGAICGIVMQSLAVLLVFDSYALTGFAQAVRRLPDIAALLEPDAYKMHSLRALSSLLPAPLGWPIWMAISFMLTAIAVKVWKAGSVPLRVRYGVLVMTSALVNPHLSIYDATVLALPAMWIGGWLELAARPSAWFWQRCYWIACATLFPTARLLLVQLTPILLAELLVRIVREARGDVRQRHIVKPVVQES